MKNLLGALLVVGLGACATPAAAEKAIITEVEPNWTQVTRNVPVETCNMAQVPVYENVQGQGATGLEVLFGALFGGLAGKAITDKDEGAAAGAVIGGVVAAEAGRAPQLRIVGYENKEICTTRYVNRTESVVKDYTIYYEWQGQYGSSIVKQQYFVDDYVDVNVSIHLVNPL